MSAADQWLYEHRGTAAVVDKGPLDDDGYGRSECPGNHWGHIYCLRVEW